jgi:sodium/hydrogen exchanger-like protein 6/7/sodium/hydrogen exchanger 8
VLTILLGLVWSVFWYYYAGHSEGILKTFEFSHSAFFDFLLPPIIYNSGFNMKRKSFFTNLGNVTIFGLGVTFVCFVEYSLFSWVALNTMDINMTQYVTEDGVPVTKKVEMSVMNILLFTSLLCSSDVVAAVSIVDFDAQPKLYSCIFGEGVANDIVSIIMFNAIMSLQGTKFTASTPLVIFEQLMILAVVSVTIGVICGFGTALIFKNFRFLNASVVTETFIMVAMALLAYFVATMTVVLNLEMSGMIAILVCGIIQAHYAWWNLSP